MSAMLASLSANCLLDLEQVILQKGRQLFGPFNLRVAAGERIAILGPSGAGKSSLLKLMASEWAPDSGHIHFMQQPLVSWRLAALSRRRAVLPQSSDVAFGLQTDLVIGLGRVARAHDPALAEIVAGAAELARAAHLLGRRLDTLSGGERARVHLARIFAQLWDVEQGLILVDEPLSALDPGLQLDLLDSLDDYARARGHAVVAILHDINQALQGFERLWLIKDGQLTHDLPATAAAVPALEDLYQLALASSLNSQGDLVVTPLRRARKRQAA